MTVVKTKHGNNEESKVKVGVHYVSALSPLLHGSHSKGNIIFQDKITIFKDKAYKI